MDIKDVEIGLGWSSRIVDQVYQPTRGIPDEEVLELIKLFFADFLCYIDQIITVLIVRQRPNSKATS